eukprot:Filipodium_phascolosomae@DN7791_c0_g1_i1.p1
MHDIYKRHQKTCDATIIVDETEFKAHSFVLASRCEYFDSCFVTCPLKESESRSINVPSDTSIDKSSFKIFLEYLYTDDLALQDLITNEAIGLLQAANYFGVQNENLIFFAEKSIRSALTKDSVISILMEVTHLGEGPKQVVEDLALEYILSNFGEMSHHPSLEQLSKDKLLLILNRIGKYVSSP